MNKIKIKKEMVEMCRKVRQIYNEAYFKII